MSPSWSTSKLYAKIPAGFVNRTVRNTMMLMVISTPNLRKLLADKTLDRFVKNRLYAFALYRRQQSRRRRHGHG